MKVSERAANMEALKNLLPDTRLTEIVDVGANPIDGTPPYRNMLNAGLCNVTAFEPQENALAKLNLAKGPRERYFPFAVGDGGLHTLHIFRGSGWASLLDIDPASMNVFQHFRPYAELIEQKPVQTLRLDDIEEIQCMDFLKIDIQGGELSVFKNAKKALSKAVFVQTEISFVPLYAGQPGFGEVDMELRSQGFIPHCFGMPVETRPISPLVFDNQPWKGLHQLVEADMVYVRDFRKPDLLSTEMLRQMAMVAHCCYASVDLVLHCLLILAERGIISQETCREYLFGKG